MMAKTVAGPILQLIRRVVEDPCIQGLPDKELLRRFSAQQDEAAFHTLLRRHGPMVLDVCRGVLGDEADAEDAFQATFLVLVRKARSIRKAASLGSWLHGVAYRTALKVRAQFAVRHKHEARAPGREISEPDNLSWREVRQVLHEELTGLAQRYREPLVVCYLEGKTQDEAAAQLRLAKSTLKERLERARALLRSRLVRRGFGPAALLVASARPAASAIACLSPALVSSTMKAATVVAAGQTAAGLISAKVAALTEGVMHTMFLTKLKNAAFILAAMVLLTAGFGVVSLAMIGLGTGLLGQEPAPSASSQEPGATEAKAPDKNVDRLDGRRWVGVSAEVDGVTCRRSGQPGVPPPSYWELKDGGCVKAQKERDEKYPNEVSFRFKYKLDAAAQPKAIDLIPEEGPARGKTLRGIYSLDKDELKICYVSPNTPELEKKRRPDELAAKKDSGYVLLVFRDLDGIGRHWKGIAAEVDGAYVPPPPLWGFGRAGGGIHVRDEYRPQESPNEVVFFFKHKLDRATTPKSIDLIPQEGPAKGKTLRGIYSLEGDQLKICYVSPSVPEPEKKARPSEFAAKKGSGHVLLVFRVTSLALDASVLDKVGFDKAELEWARGVLAAAREHDVTCTKSFHEAWGKDMEKAERWVHIWAMAKNLDAEDALPAKVRHPIANQVGKAAPALEGIWHNTAKPLTWNDLKGKVVLLDFISEGFEPCVKNLPKLKALHEQFHDKGLVVISVLAKRVEKGPPTVPAFVKRHAIAFPVMVDPAEPGNPGKTFKRYGIRMMPTYILVDGTGNVVARDGLRFHDVPTADEIKKLLGP